jgi:acetyl-CoA carboxylase biotin carboxyl carrier protein
MTRPDIDTAYIETLAEILGRTGLSEIEIGHGDLRIRVRRRIRVVADAGPAASPTAAEPQVAPLASAVLPTGDALHPGTVTSPMVGTAYLSPEASAPPFVSEGDEVREGQTLLIIEAMKVMNAIRAPRSGRVTRVLVQNAAPVEYGEPLMIIE